MAYQIVEFDGAALPLYNPRQDHSGAAVESALLPSVGGVFDAYGPRRKRGRMQQIKLSGEYWAEEWTRVTNGGSVRVTDDGSVRVTGTPGAVLLGQIMALRSRLGVQGRLWRVRLDDNVRQWVTARLLQVDCPQVPEDRTVVVRAACLFESAMDAWRAASETVTHASLTAGVVGVMVPCRSSADVEDAVIEVAAGGSGITSLAIQSPGIDLRFDGAIANGQTLVIDCGAQTVRVGDVDAYDQFSLGPGHTAQGWCPLAPGDNVFVVTSDQAGALAFRHYDQVI